MPSAWQRSISATRRRGSAPGTRGRGWPGSSRYEPCASTRAHAARRHRLAERAPPPRAPSGRPAHCIWLRVKIWMASAPMAAAVAGRHGEAAGDGHVGAEQRARQVRIGIRRRPDAQEERPALLLQRGRAASGAAPRRQPRAEARRRAPALEAAGLVGSCPARRRRPSPRSRRRARPRAVARARVEHQRASPRTAGPRRSTGMRWAPSTTKAPPVLEHEVRLQVAQARRVERPGSSPTRQDPSGSTRRPSGIVPAARRARASIAADDNAATVTT